MIKKTTLLERVMDARQEGRTTDEAIAYVARCYALPESVVRAVVDELEEAV